MVHKRDACYCTGHQKRKYTRRAKRFLRVYFLVLKGSQGALPLHTTLLARCSVLHPTETERMSRMVSLPVDDWPDEVIRGCWGDMRAPPSLALLYWHNRASWGIDRRLLRAIPHKMRPSVYVAVYGTVMHGLTESRLLCLLMHAY